jgi:hypothetical protein
MPIAELTGFLAVNGFRYDFNVFLRSAKWQTNLRKPPDDHRMAQPH